MAISICFSLLLIFLSQFPSSHAEPFIGVNYGQVADNLPPPSETAKLLQTTSIQKVRLYGADPAIIKALAGTGVGIVIGAANGDLPSLAADPNAASQWISANVLPFYPASKIILITVGNEVLLSTDPNLANQLLPAMQNVQKALEAASLGGKIKVSTVHAMSVLGVSEPPSSGSFASGYQAGLKGVLQFLSDTGSLFAVNPYPFFAYQSDPRPETLAFCLFQPNAGRPDHNTGITYMNMFDAQVDAVHSALKSMGFEKVEIVVAETGWASRGDPNEVGPSVDNAKAYNGNLIAHLRSMVGTPLMPGKSVDTYIFALYDENLKTGPSSERAFGLFKTDHSMAYDVGLAKSSTGSSSSNSSSQTPSGKVTSTGWCVPKKGATDEQLQSSIDWACGQGIDCGPIQPGGACFEPNNVASHAAFAMNMYFQKSPKRTTDCDFSQTATITSQNPSYNSCVYPGGGGGGAGSAGVMNKYVNSDKLESKKNGAVEPKVYSSLSFLIIIMSLILHVYVMGR
ncbi:glucan endo-1,3-beta-glucosidase 7-like [Raphanus sativus]|uniref:glucan endo-1,3-beta-D-glucosidase n=1 Tax=Raphanus sativus TaxID=3726 RepID=A0A6J0N7A3_RAPSA|nr:glucan endo-1,3-beta-glucosidase 7-like [Raphanus sativus]